MPSVPQRYNNQFFKVHTHAHRAHMRTHPFILALDIQKLTQFLSFVPRSANNKIYFCFVSKFIDMFPFRQHIDAEKKPFFPFSLQLNSMLSTYVFVAILSKRLPHNQKNKSRKTHKILEGNGWQKTLFLLFSLSLSPSPFSLSLFPSKIDRGPTVHPTDVDGRFIVALCTRGVDIELLTLWRDAHNRHVRRAKNLFSCTRHHNASTMLLPDPFHFGRLKRYFIFQRTREFRFSGTGSCTLAHTHTYSRFACCRTSK